jgi:tetratricopeptide (TPR) repeat protein
MVFSVRAMPGGYIAVSFVLSFIAALIAYLEWPIAALPVLAISFLIVPSLWFFDRVVFDGRRVRRTGLVPFLFARVTGLRDRLKISDIEQIETAVLRRIRRGRNVSYTYRTIIVGKSVRFVVSSRHRGYREFIKALLPRVAEDILDNGSIDLRDYLTDNRLVMRRALESDIPSSDVLDGAFSDIQLKSARITRKRVSVDDRIERADHLRRLANELRLSGRLLQALEAFRRAAILRPRDARLLFEFAECLRSMAGSDGDEKLERNAMAMMRLAERHAGDDNHLLARIGETYFHIGEWRRAGIVFKRVVDVFGDNFRALRGMAELSLREGKLAHVIHNFAAAQEFAATTSLRRWTRSEVEYFSHLNEDEEYMELEISRVNLLDTLDRTRKSAVRILLMGLIVILLGLTLGDLLVANIGWAISGISLLLWIVMVVMMRMLAPRIPFELMETDE